MQSLLDICVEVIFVKMITPNDSKLDKDANSINLVLELIRLPRFMTINPKKIK
jgi:hypothetical protein